MVQPPRPAAPPIQADGIGRVGRRIHIVVNQLAIVLPPVDIGAQLVLPAPGLCSHILPAVQQVDHHDLGPVPRYGTVILIGHSGKRQIAPGRADGRRVKKAMGIEARPRGYAPDGDLGVIEGVPWKYMIKIVQHALFSPDRIWQFL